MIDMKHGISGLVALTATLLLFCGCVSERPADITLDELEGKMAQAMDPVREYRNAYAYFQRQNIEEEGLFSKKYQLLEVRFQRPDKFKFSFYDKNTIATEILSVNKRAWMIDHKKGIITEIHGNALEKFRIMLAMGHPDTDYDSLFSKIDMSLVTLDDDREYYKLVCQPALEKSNPIIIYVDKLESLPKRMELQIKTGQGEIRAVNNIVEFRKFNNVNIPVLTLVQEGSREYTTRVVGYQLNAHFRPDEFKLPEFDPVLMEMKKQRQRR